MTRSVTGVPLAVREGNRWLRRAPAYGILPWMVALARRGPNSVLHIAHESLRPNLGAVDIAGRVRGDAFGRASSRYLLYRVGNEGNYGSVAHVPDANAALPTIVILGNRFRL